MKNILTVTTTIIVFVFMLRSDASAFWFFDYATNNGCRIELIEYKDILHDTVVETIAFVYDGEGNIIKMIIDDDGEKAIFNFDYDSSGKVEKSTIDGNDDGYIDRVGYYFYNVDGNIERIDFDGDLDGNISEVENYKYDGESKLTKIELTDADSDEIKEGISISYSDYGRAKEVKFFGWGSNGYYVEVEYWDYDDDEKLKEIEVDIDDDGSIDQVGTPIWDCEPSTGYPGDNDDGDNSSSGCCIGALK